MNAAAVGRSRFARDSGQQEQAGSEGSGKLSVDRLVRSAGVEGRAIFFCVGNGASCGSLALPLLFGVIPGGQLMNEWVLGRLKRLERFAEMPKGADLFASRRSGVVATMRL